MKGYFVTGTDTEVGKTLISSALIYLLNSRGTKTCGFKPVVAGTHQIHQEVVNEDLISLLLSTNLNRALKDHLKSDDICPYILNEAAAPHIVAKQQGVNLDLEVMLKSYSQLRHSHDAVIVEGAGGFYVPINKSQTLADFAQKIQLPVILVVDIKLGCINHALLTANAIQERDLTMAGWVANSTSTTASGTLGTSNTSTHYQENVDTIGQFFLREHQAPLLGQIPFNLIHSSPYSKESIQLAASLITNIKL